MNEETALQIKTETDLAEIPVTPAEISVKVKSYMENKPKKIEFNGQRYPEFDDYQYAASFFGWRVVTESEPITINDITGFKGKAKIVDKNGIEVGQADSYCFSNERNWANKPLFQLGSMAQTRAGSKALANILRPIFKLAGYEAMPVEEMQSEPRTVQQPKPRNLPANTPAPDSDGSPGFPDEIGENVGSADVGIDFPAPSDNARKVIGDPNKKVTEKQRKMLYAVYKSKGIEDEKIKSAVKLLFGLEHTAHLTNGQLQQLIELIEKGGIR